ncbi:hypothetical protein ACFOD9_02990 [Novosphingobium bradum]|uniref:Energy transducer TonB n=1 Tax=Novosphingobium bradum TaxID=1737444 RepID=A0ABV7IR95_9SPHN
MILPSSLTAPAAHGPSRRERAISALLSLAICAALGFMLARMGAFAPAAPGNGSRLVAVDLSQHEADKPRQAQRTQAHQVAAPSATAPVIVPPQPTPSATPLPPLALIPLTRAEMASADIGRMARRGPAAGPPAPNAGGASDAGGGDGPGGAHLYAAQWVREPTRAEMATYIPKGANAPGSWAVIACRTIEGFHVEDCREMAENPPGSGLARGLRQAAWQFLVRPPRVGGQPLIGSWVRIRFDFTRDPDHAEAGAGAD